MSDGRTISHADDLALARRAAAAEPHAWDEVIRLYGGPIYNLALRFSGETATAEDLTQEIFLRLYRNLHRYRGDVPLVAWALRLSRNLCIDHYRQARARVHSRAVSEDHLLHLATEDDPQADAQHRERLQLVHRALGEMSEGLASILTLRDLQGLSYEEIAAFLEVPAGTVKSRLHRARRELLNHLERYLELPPLRAAGAAS